MSEYSFVEKPFLDQLDALGWTVIDQGPGIPTGPTKSLQTSFGEVTLHDVFNQAVRAINTIPEANLKGQESGWLVFGVSNKPPRQMVGSNYRLQAPGLDKLKGEIAMHTNHQITFQDIHVVTRSEGRVVLFQIPRWAKWRMSNPPMEAEN